MFLLGFICGVLVLTVLLLLCDHDDRFDSDETATAAVSAASIADTWEQTRNFLYYDGTEMPIKEERYE